MTAPDRSLLTAEIPHLRRYARALLRDPTAAEDLVQSSLERALSRLHLWQPDRRLRPWLFAIMHNLFVSSVRRRTNAPVLVPLSEAVIPAVSASQEAYLDASRVLAAVSALSDEQRTVVLLIALEGLSYKEAAEVLDIPVGTLMSRLHRGRERLREVLGMGKAAPALHRVK